MPKVTMDIPEDPEFYAKVFDRSNRNWDPDPENVEMFFRVQEGYFNDMLSVHGHLFLNDVYSALGFDHTPQGAVVGWLNTTNGVDIDVERIDQSEFKLTFNVNGYIADKI